MDTGDGLKRIFLSPHHDDETLFASYTLMRYKPDVAVCFLSAVQEQYGISQTTRANETTRALAELGLPTNWRQWGYYDNDPDLKDLRERVLLLSEHYDACFAPLPEDGGHDQHNSVGEYAKEAFGDQCRFYATYWRGSKRTHTEFEVVPEPDWYAKKFKAMACYTSQINLDNCRPWFSDWDREWVA